MQTIADSTRHAAPTRAPESVRALVRGLKSSHDQVRTDAWLNAGKVGPPAVKAVAKLMQDDDAEVARAAKRALWKIVHQSGRPGARRERHQVTHRLLGLLDRDRPNRLRAEVLHMLAEIAGNASVGPVARFLSDPKLREDARQVLQQIPVPQALGALKAALRLVPEDFRTPIAAALRARGVQVAGYPCQKLVPTKPTSVTPLSQV